MPQLALPAAACNDPPLPGGRIVNAMQDPSRHPALRLPLFVILAGAAGLGAGLAAPAAPPLALPSVSPQASTATAPLAHAAFAVG